MDKSKESCDCGCQIPTFTEPFEALKFLSGRFKYAGVAEVVAKSYAKDIDTILEKEAAMAKEMEETKINISRESVERYIARIKGYTGSGLGVLLHALLDEIDRLNNGDSVDTK